MDTHGIYFLMLFIFQMLFIIETLLVLLHLHVSIVLRGMLRREKYATTGFSVLRYHYKVQYAKPIGTSIAIILKPGTGIARRECRSYYGAGSA